MPNYLIGVDIGTSATKTILIDHKGALVASASADYPCLFPKPGWSEQDPQHWWNATVKTIQQVMKKSK